MLVDRDLRRSIDPRRYRQTFVVHDRDKELPRGESFVVVLMRSDNIAVRNVDWSIFGHCFALRRINRVRELCGPISVNNRNRAAELRTWVFRV